MENYCIYLRKSRADQEAEARGEMETLKRHEELLLSLALKRQYPIKAIYREVVSGETIAARPVMQKLLREVEEGNWDGVLVVEVERLARGDTIDQGTVARAFQFSDTKIITPSKTYDPNNEFDQEYFEFGLFMSRREYKAIRRRLSAGRLSSAREGKYTGNVPPYGYQRIKLPGEKGYTLSPTSEAEVVRMIFRWYCPLEGTSHPGPGIIARQLNEQGILSPGGGLWSPSAVRGILSNPVYAGYICFGRRQTQKHLSDGQITKSRPRNPHPELYPGRHPAIIDRELFFAAQERKKTGGAPFPSRKELKNPLSGLIRCSCCGRSMIRRPYSGSAKEDMLICPTPGCPTVSSRLSLVEKQLLLGLAENLRHITFPSSAELPSPSASASSPQALLSLQEKNLKGLEAQEERLYDFLEQGIYSAEVFQARLHSLKERIAFCSDRICALSKELSASSGLSSPSGASSMAGTPVLQDYWEWDTAARHDVLSLLLEKAVYHKSEKCPSREGNLVRFQLDIFPKLL